MPVCTVVLRYRKVHIIFALVFSPGTFYVGWSFRKWCYCILPFLFFCPRSVGVLAWQAPIYLVKALPHCGFAASYGSSLIFKYTSQCGRAMQREIAITLGSLTIVILSFLWNILSILYHDRLLRSIHIVFFCGVVSLLLEWCLLVHVRWCGCRSGYMAISMTWSVCLYSRYWSCNNSVHVYNLPWLFF